MGQVKFFVGTTAIGTATMNGGVAKLTRSTFRVGTRSITAELPGECHLGCWAARALVVVLPSPGRWPASQELCPRLLHRIDACPACG